MPGVPLVAGTDTPPIPGLVPGFSLHADLLALHQAGLSSCQVLAAATRTPGEFIRLAQPTSEHFGMVAPGNRADLILTATRRPFHSQETVGGNGERSLVHGIQPAEAPGQRCARI